VSDVVNLFRPEGMLDKETDILKEASLPDFFEHPANKMSFDKLSGAALDRAFWERKLRLGYLCVFLPGATGHVVVAYGWGSRTESANSSPPWTRSTATRTSR
jgi:hypothetical protein